MGTQGPRFRDRLEEGKKEMQTDRQAHTHTHTHGGRDRERETQSD